MIPWESKLGQKTCLSKQLLVSSVVFTLNILERLAMNVSSDHCVKLSSEDYFSRITALHMNVSLHYCIFSIHRMESSSIIKLYLFSLDRVLLWKSFPYYFRQYHKFLTDFAMIDYPSYDSSIWHGARPCLVISNLLRTVHSLNQDLSHICEVRLEMSGQIFS